MKKEYKFTIIITNYNKEKWIGKCLDSILKQTYKKYEIIFIDDLSKDNSLEIAKKKLNNSTNAKIIELRQKRYNGGAMNVGILEATGDYIIVVNSEDWLKSNNSLEILNNKLNGEDIAFIGYDKYNGNREYLTFTPKYQNLYSAFTTERSNVWSKVVRTPIMKRALFPEGMICDGKINHYKVIDKCRKYINIEESIYCWNKYDNENSQNVMRLEKEASQFGELGQMYKFIKQCKNDNYRQFVIMKYNRLKEEMKKGVVKL